MAILVPQLGASRGVTGFGVGARVSFASVPSVFELSLRKGGSGNLHVLALKQQQEQSAIQKERGRGPGSGSWTERDLPKNGGKESKVTKKKDNQGRSSNMKVEPSTVAPVPVPSPPAGFILNEQGAVVLVAPAANRIVTIVDPSTRRPLECMIRRAFQSSDGENCLLLLPLDMPLQILKIDERSEGFTELSDEELQEVIPATIYALAKRRLHLIISGFCLTARGGFCYTEEHVLDFKTEFGEGLGGSLVEGVEIAHFQVNDTEYIVYTPFDPVMFVAHVNEETGELKIASDDLLNDEVVLDAVDEENEFQALVDEEDAMRDTLREAR